MGLEVGFELAKTEVLFQERAYVTLTLRNTGVKPVHVVNPEFARTLPIQYVLDLATGEETTWRGSAEPANFEPTQSLGPAETEQSHVILNPVLLKRPGKYEVFLRYEWNDGQEKADSKPVVVNVLPTTPRNLYLESAQGANLYATWVNLAAEKPQIVLSKIFLMGSVGVESTDPIAFASTQARPVLSVGPKRLALPGHWIGWIDDDALAFTYASHYPGVAPTPVRELDLPAGVLVEIVPPLICEYLKDDRVGPTGAALLWLGNRDRTVSRLQSVQLTTKGATLGAKLDLPGSPPRWIMVHPRERISRLVTYVQSDAGKTALSAVSWPGSPAGIPVRKLCDWEGAFVGSGGNLMEDETVIGATLLWTGPTPSRELSLVTWRIDLKNAPQEQAPKVLTWDRPRAIEHARVRVSTTGQVTALLRDDAGIWLIYDGRGPIRELSGALASCKLPIDVAFLDESKPIVVYGVTELGLSVVHPDGSPVRDPGF